MTTSPVRVRARSAALVLAALVAAGLLSVLPAAPASAATATSVTLSGHGYGHGRGLGQYGALGYAVDYGWSGGQILDHYYGGTTAGDVGNPDLTVRLTAFDGANQVSVVSARDFWVGDASGAFLVPGGQAATIARSGSAWVLTTTAGCGGGQTGGPATLPAITEVAPAVAPSSPGDVLTSCLTGRGYRGKLRLVTDAGSTRLVNVVDTQSYLRGVVPRESPAGWGDLGGGRGLQALAAQAVAARSYALSETRSSYAKTCDTTACQVYGGAALNGSWIEDPRTDRAVADTSGTVRMANGAVVRTEFSSSTGGYTAGGAFPAVPDLGDSRSAYHDWTVELSAADIQAAYPGIGTFSSLQVLARNGLGEDGGRVTSLKVTGTAGSQTTTGNDFRIKMGLRSDWFTPLSPTTLWSELRDDASAGPAQHQVLTGDPAGTVLACDVLGTGTDQLAVYTAGQWSLRASLSTGPADKVFGYGAAGWIPVCGDWDGDGKAGIGVYDPSTGTWYLRNIAGPGSPDATVRYGWSGALPVVGDWDGNGTTTIGVWDKQTGVWMIRNANSPGNPDLSLQYGFRGAVPVPGDFDGNGRTDLGVYSAGTWYLRTSLTPGPADRQFGYGLTSDLPYVGDWSGAGRSGIAVVRPGRG